MANERRRRRRERRQERREQRAQAAASMQINPPAAAPYRTQTPQNVSHSQYGSGIRQLQQFNRGGTGFGAAALERARAGGMSDQDIRNALFYGRYNVGEAAFNQLFGGGQRPSNTMGGRVLRNPDATVANVSGYGTKNWNTDTLKHMQERRNYLQSMGIRGAFSPERAAKAIAAKDWQPSNSFAELGDQRWYAKQVMDAMRIAAANAVARSGRYRPQSSAKNLMSLGITL